MMQPHELFLTGLLAIAELAVLVRTILRPHREPEIHRVDLSGTLAGATERIVGEVERRKIEQALHEAGGNRAKAAEALQVGFRAFTAKLREHGLDA